jgi:hypothetical protein
VLDEADDSGREIYGGSVSIREVGVDKKRLAATAEQQGATDWV